MAGLHILYRGTAAIVRTTDIRQLARSLLAEISSGDLAERQDAIYLSAGAIVGAGSAAVVPSFFISQLARLRRRAQVAGVTLPGTTTVALDPASLSLVRTTAIVSDEELTGALAALPDGSEPDARAIIAEPTRVGAILSLGPSEVPALQPFSRSLALYRWGGRVLNLRALGGGAIEPLGRLFLETPSLSVTWHDPRGWLEPLGVLLDDPAADPAGDPAAGSADGHGRTRGALLEIRARADEEASGHP